MIALTLMMSLVLATMQVYQYGVDSWNRGDEILTETDVDTVTFSFMRKMFGKLVAENWVPKRPTNPRDSFGQTQENYKVFDGNHQKMRFAAPLPVHHGKDLGIFLFEFDVDQLPGDVTKSLVVRYYPIEWESLEKTLDQEPKTEMLMPNVKRIKLAYYGDKDLSNGDDDPQWEDDWEKQFYLPLAVRISIERSEPPEGERMRADDYNEIVIRLARRYVR